MSPYEILRARHRGLLGQLIAGQRLDVGEVRGLINGINTDLAEVRCLEDRRDLRHLFLFWASYLSLRDEDWPEADLVATHGAGQPLHSRITLTEPTPESSVPSASMAADGTAGPAPAGAAPRDWETELRRVMLGERETEIDHARNAADYLEGLLSQSSDQAASRTYFLDALDRLLSTWTPDEKTSSRSVSHLLDIIAKYTPPTGWPKLVRLLSRRAEPAEGTGTALTAELRQSGLRALAAYPEATYGVAGQLRDKAVIAYDEFGDVSRAAYRQLLWSHLSLPECALYAARALLDSQLVNLQREEIASMILAGPLVIRGVLLWLFEAPGEGTALVYFPSIYSACLYADRHRASETRLERIFCDEVVSLGGKVAFAGEGPVITLPSSTVVTLDLRSDDHYDVYFQLFCERQNAQAEQTIDKALSAVGTQGQRCWSGN